MDEYIDAYVLERKRQQEAAEAQRARDAAATEEGKTQADSDEENFDLQEVITFCPNYLVIQCFQKLSEDFLRDFFA